MDWSAGTSAMPADPGRPRQLRIALSFVGAALGCLLIPQVKHPGIYLIAGAMAACWLIPLWYDWSRARLDLFQPTHSIGFLYFVYFGLGSIWIVNDPVNIAIDRYIAPYVPLAAVYCTFGYLALLFGYSAPWYGRPPVMHRRERPGSNLFVMIPGLIGLAGFAGEIAWHRGSGLGISLSGMISSLAQLTPLFLFAWALVWLLYFGSSNRSWRDRWLLFGFFTPAALGIALFSLNDKSLTMTLIGVPIIAMWYGRRRIPWLFLLVLLLVLIFVVFPFYNTYRMLDPRLDGGMRAGATYTIITNWDLEQYMDRSLRTFRFRMALVNSVATVLRDVGRWVPYESGATLFLPSVAFFIPRILWPDKPMFTLGREFGEKFRLVHMLDDSSSVASTVPGELYWNFGFPGILVGMALGGMMIRVIYRRYGEGDQFQPVRRAIYIVMFVQLVHYGGGIAAQTVTVIRTVLVLEAFCWVARRVGLLVTITDGGAGSETENSNNASIAAGITK